MSESELIFTSPISWMQLRSQVRIAKPFEVSRRLMVKWHSVYAVWDTGAVTSAVSRRIAEQLHLKARERAILSTGAGMLPTVKDIILLDLQIGNGVIPVKVAIVDNVPGEGNDFLIGMDVIQCGDFSISTCHITGVYNVRFKPYPGLFRTVEDVFKIHR